MKHYSKGKAPWLSLALVVKTDSIAAFQQLEIEKRLQEKLLLPPRISHHVPRQWAGRR